MTPLVRLGLIGLGHWGKNCFRTLRQLEEQGLLQLAAVATGSRQDLDVEIFPHWQDLLRHGRCDGVVIATPAHTHVEIARAALKDGIAVFVEKPLSTDLMQAIDLYKEFNAAPVPFVVDHIHLFNPAFQELEILAARMGPILKIEAESGKPSLPHPQLPVMWDWGAHDVAMCLRLFNHDPSHIEARIEARPVLDDGIGEIVRLSLVFGTADVCLRLGSLPERRRVMKVHCRDGVLCYDDTQPQDKLKIDGMARPVDLTRPPLVLALTEFCRRIVDDDRRNDQLRLAVSVVDILSQAQARLTR